MCIVQVQASGKTFFSFFNLGRSIFLSKTIYNINRCRYQSFREETFKRFSFQFLSSPLSSSYLRVFAKFWRRHCFERPGAGDWRESNWVSLFYLSHSLSMREKVAYRRWLQILVLRAVCRKTNDHFFILIKALMASSWKGLPTLPSIVQSFKPTQQSFHILSDYFTPTDPELFG